MRNIAHCWSHVSVPTFSAINDDLPPFSHCQCYHRVCFVVSLFASWLPKRCTSTGKVKSLMYFSKLDAGTNSPIDERTKSFFFTVMTYETQLYMDGRTFPWLKLLIVKRRVFAQYIFSICVMFSLPLWMASVYCELPLEDLVWDQISLSQLFPSACLLHMFICSAQHL